VTFTSAPLAQSAARYEQSIGGFDRFVPLQIDRPVDAEHVLAVHIVDATATGAKGDASAARAQSRPHAKAAEISKSSIACILHELIAARRDRTATPAASAGSSTSRRSSRSLREHGSVSIPQKALIAALRIGEE